MSFSAVGLSWDIHSFRQYLQGVNRPSWAKSVTLHHTAAPSLAQRPSGLTDQHVLNIRDFYQRQLGWRSGPQLFVDDKRIMGMTPITERGVHAVSFNSSSIGIEVLGDYDSEDPRSGRGYAAWNVAAETTMEILYWLGLEPTSKTVLFHRDDPRTSKTCPGKKVSKDWVLELMRNGEQPIIPVPADDCAEEFVPLVEYVSARTGGSITDTVALLRMKGDLTYLGEQWIERAYYDKGRSATMAPRTEADDAVKWIEKWQSEKATGSVEIVPVVAYIASRLSVPYCVAAHNLTYRNGEFRWAGEAISGASFNKALQSTVAPKGEIDRIILS